MEFLDRIQQMENRLNCQRLSVLSFGLRMSPALDLKLWDFRMYRIYVHMYIMVIFSLQ